MKNKFVWVSLISILILTSIYFYKFYYKNFLFDADYSNGISLIKKELSKHSSDNKTYKYFYYNIWNLKCKPCIKEMPELDSIAGNLSNKIKFVFVSDDDENAVNKFLNKNKIKMKNFIFINDMNYFISAIYKKVNNKYKVYPTHIVMDSLDNVLFFSQGSVTKLNLEGLKLNPADKKRFLETLKDPLIKKLESLN